MSQCLQKTLAALLTSFPRLCLGTLCLLLSVPPSSFSFLFSVLSYDPGGVTIGEVLRSCTKFSPSVRVRSHTATGEP